jgi:hypothetical protein
MFDILTTRYVEAPSSPELWEDSNVSDIISVTHSIAIEKAPLDDRLLPGDVPVSIPFFSTKSEIQDQ